MRAAQDVSIGHGPADLVASFDNMLTTNQRGAVAEGRIICAALELGIGVFRAVLDERYDLVFDLRPNLLRVQCKTAVLSGDVIVIRCYSCRRSPSGLLKRRYTSEEIDAIAAYCAELSRCFLIPVERISERSHIQLRVAPTRNNQHLGINWADDFDFAAKLAPQGAVAQLGEHLTGSQKATGSSPVGSTP
jgi:PD-(D/E)XK endonuclease